VSATFYARIFVNSDPLAATVRDDAGHTLGKTPLEIPVEHVFEGAPGTASWALHLDKDGYSPLLQSVTVSDWATKLAEAGAHYTRVDWALAPLPFSGGAVSTLLTAHPWILARMAGTIDGQSAIIAVQRLPNGRVKLVFTGGSPQDADAGDPNDEDLLLDASQFIVTFSIEGGQPKVTVDNPDGCLPLRSGVWRLVANQTVLEARAGDDESYTGMQIVQLNASALGLRGAVDPTEPSNVMELAFAAY
jgi:hypothetical protein